jgi:hypothetical protein
MKKPSSALEELRSELVRRTKGLWEVGGIYRLVGLSCHVLCLTLARLLRGVATVEI